MRAPFSLMSKGTILAEHWIQKGKKQMRAMSASRREPNPGDMVTVRSPFVDELLRYNFRGYAGDKMILVSSTGIQTALPKEWLTYEE